MRRHQALTLIAIVSTAAAGIWGVRALIHDGRETPDAGSRRLMAAIADVDAGRRTTPLLGDLTPGGGITVTFLARREGGQVPRVVSDVTGWGEHIDGTFDFTVGTMTRVGGTDWYSLQVEVASRARIEYRLAYGMTDYRFDPHNPRRSAGPNVGGAPASEFVTAGYAPPAEFEGPPPTPSGELREAAIEGPCRVEVYTPAGYRAEGNAPAAIFLDSRSRQSARVLDWLIARREIPPVVAAFVSPRSPGDERCSSTALPSFVAGPLLRWLAVHRRVSPRAEDHAVLAISYHAKDALEIVVEHAEAFAAVGLLIPGRRLTPADIDAAAAHRSTQLRVAILAGQYDRANLPTARRLRVALAGAGHHVDYLEIAEGHSAVTWRNHLLGVLVGLFGRAHE